MKNKKIEIGFCSDLCVLKKYETRIKDFGLEFSGASKECKVGIKLDDSFIVEKKAESWDGGIHDFGITVNREYVVKNNETLIKIMQINHDNILKIKNICSCCVELEYLDGYILNTKKGRWIMGSHAYEQDYLDICKERDFWYVCGRILDALRTLHAHQICHTDIIDHNIMIEKKTETPVLIDLIGTMPYTEELACLDRRNFVEHVIISGAHRNNYEIPVGILNMKEKNGIFELREIEEIIDKRIKEV